MALPREVEGTATPKVFDENVVYPELDGSAITVAVPVGAVDLKLDRCGIRRIVNAITVVVASIRGVVPHDEVILGSHQEAEGHSVLVDIYASSE